MWQSYIECATTFSYVILYYVFVYDNPLFTSFIRKNLLSQKQVEYQKCSSPRKIFFTFSIASRKFKQILTQEVCTIRN